MPSTSTTMFWSCDWKR